MEEKVKYFVGYENDGEIIKIELELTPEFQKCCRSSNRLRNIDFFTQTFDYKTFLDFLKARKLINVIKEIKLYKKIIDLDTNVEEVIELRGGFAFSDSISYFQTNNIKKYFHDHITNQDFLIACIDFFKKYFGFKKPVLEELKHFEREQFLSENMPPLYPSYRSLLDYLDFSKKKVPYETKRENLIKRQLQEKHEREKIGDCRIALVKMLKDILETDSDEEGLNYEGLRDLALFVSNFEQQHHLEKEKYVVRDHLPGSQSKAYAQSNERDDVTRLF